ncbi:MAG TPA: hypothetical protein VHL14_04360 [Steroidobacteraceae bacterium]|jgi:hypothetical protein|nr:hypothetical protein [Steroidobacteraceae bacterium]
MSSKNLLALALLSFGAIALADDVAMPSANEAPQMAAPVKLPPRGSTMNSVEAAFGAPSQREPAVGEPPITRWDYPAFVVYFEHDKVIHSVVK